VICKAVSAFFRSIGGFKARLLSFWKPLKHPPPHNTPTPTPPTPGPRNFQPMLFDPTGLFFSTRFINVSFFLKLVARFAYV